MDRSALIQKLRDTCRLSGEFRLRSGRGSAVYWDKYRFESDPVVLAAVADVLAALLPPGSRLAALEMGGIPVGVALSARTGVPCLFVRKRPKQYGTCQQIEGGFAPGDRVVLVEDVVTSGGAVCDAIEAARAVGLITEHVLCVIDREQGGGEAFAALGCELRAGFKMSELETGG